MYYGEFYEYLKYITVFVSQYVQGDNFRYSMNKLYSYIRIYY